MSEEATGESLEETQASPETQAVEPQAEQSQEPESTPENEKPDAGEDDQEHKLPKGVQKRIDRLTREKYRLQARLEAMEATSPKPQQEQQRQPTEDAPKAEQFASYEEFLEAKAEWKAEQKVQSVLSQYEEKQKAQAANAESSKIQQSWAKRVEAAMDVYDDFEDVAMSPDLPISKPMMDSIVRADKGADVAYFLGKNPEVAAQIASLDPISAAIRIGEIAATVARPQAKKQTSAPAPITPVGSRSGGPQKDPSKMSDAEWYAAKRNSK